MPSKELALNKQWAQLNKDPEQGTKKSEEQN